MDKKGLLVVISGCSGAGKGTVLTEFFKLAKNAAYSVSATTRSPRAGEEDGVQYHFISREQFEKHIEEHTVLEYTQYCGNYYGTLKSELNKLADGRDLILEIELEGATNIKRLIPDAVTIVIVPPSLAVLEERLRGRGTNTEEDIRRRMAQAAIEMKHTADYDYVIVNRDGCAADAAEKITGILEAEKHRTSRNAELLATLTCRQEPRL